MNYQNKIISFALTQNGYIRSNDLLKICVPRVYLSILTKKNIIRKICRGIYILSSHTEDDFFVLHLKYSLIRYSRTSLVFLHNLSHQSLNKYTANLPLHYSEKAINDIVCYRTNELIYNLGFCMIETPQGMKVPSYNIERCICELFMFPNEFDAEEKKHALLEAKNHKFNPDILIEYAKKLNVEKEIRTYLEVI